MSPRLGRGFRLAAEVPGERQPASFWLMLSDDIEIGCPATKWQLDLSPTKLRFRPWGALP